MFNFHFKGTRFEMKLFFMSCRKPTMRDKEKQVTQANKTCNKNPKKDETNREWKLISYN
jgi:hypothetical protein